MLVIDRLIAIDKLDHAPGGKLPSLFKMVKKLVSEPPRSIELASVCHGVRLEGNRILHYSPGRFVSVDVSPFRLENCLRKVSEAAEMMMTGKTSIYEGSLPSRLSAMYRQLRDDWMPKLSGKEESGFQLGDALLLVFRSVAMRLQPEWLDALASLDVDDALPENLSAESEDAIRQLRNLGLIEHDGQWLFSPTRSKRAWPSSRGRFLLRLDRKSGEVSEDLAVEVIRSLSQVQKGSHLYALLKRLQHSEAVQAKDETSLRKLRNLNLVEHPSYFLAGAKVAYLTDLGSYVLGELEGD